MQRKRWILDLLAFSIVLVGGVSLAQPAEATESRKLCSGAQWSAAGNHATQSCMDQGYSGATTISCEADDEGHFWYWWDCG